jgi:hypothetical protein
MIKVINRRKKGSLFHYAHFLCDCLFPEIINKIYLQGEVIREKSINQTLGNFSKIYEEVMGTRNRELLKEEFNQLATPTLIYKTKEDYLTIDYFNEFRDFIFRRYNIPPPPIHTHPPSNSPQILLIKRDDRIPLIDDPYLTSLNTNITTGKERREIDQIDKLESHLQSNYNTNFRALYLERLSFEEQVRYFHNASFIICAHGAGMSNMFFCKSSTTIFEVVCGREWEFFDVISTILSLNHIKCNTNDINMIIPALDSLLKN